MSYIGRVFYPIGRTQLAPREKQGKSTGVFFIRLLHSLYAQTHCFFYNFKIFVHFVGATGDCIFQNIWYFHRITVK